MNPIKFVAPSVGDHFLVAPECKENPDEGTIVVTDVNITPNGFIVEGLPILRDEDDYSVFVREFVTV